MEQNHIHTSPEAATYEPAFPATHALSEVEGPALSEVEGTGAPEAPPLSLPEQLVSQTLNQTFPETERRARHCRHDGWTPERQVAFLEALAACGVVMDACKQVGLSAQSAYAFRNRRSGRAFGTAWDAVLVHRARGRLSDELLSRAMNGCIEAVHQNGAITGERHRFDNRLSMAVLTRLDRLAEKQGEREGMLRAVSQDLDDFLDCVQQGGDADAFVEARRPEPEPEAAPEPERGPRVGDFCDQLAALHGCLDYKDMDPAEIDISDLPGPDLEDCSTDQFLRAHYSGYLAWLEARAAHARRVGQEGIEEDSPQTYMNRLRARSSPAFAGEGDHPKGGGGAGMREHAGGPAFAGGEERRMSGGHLSTGGRSLGDHPKGGGGAGMREHAGDPAFEAETEQPREARSHTGSRHPSTSSTYRNGGGEADV
jgi:hypothetical protein